MSGINAPRSRTHFRYAAVALCTFLLAALLTSLTTTSSSAAIDPCGSGGNKISCENSKTGSPQSEWDIDGAGDAGIQGFATNISVNVGTKVDFKIDSSTANYKVTIYRTGYYGGLGARKIATVNPVSSVQNQPQCITDNATELYDCGNWAVSASWNVPATAVSGVYIAKLQRNDNGDVSHITFIVRDDSSRSTAVFQTSDPTWHAYNTYGGSDFYQGAANGRAYKISYNRPFTTREGTTSRDFYFSAEYAMVRFMEKNGYDVSYIAGVDSDRSGALIKNHKVFLSVGHDEYWSKGQRANVEAARDAGVNLMFLSGNEVYWKTRYEASADSSNTAYRTLTSYKETWSNSKIDPSPEWTGTWRDPRFAPKDKGAGVPENELTGTIYMANYTDLPITVSANEGKLRLWRNTGLQSQSAGAKTALAAHTVGYESDEDLDNGSRPKGLIRLSTTTGPTPEYLQDFGNNVAPGTTTHNMTMYKAPSGALVFSAGTVQWTWGLDATHDGNGAPADKRIQQAQVNLFADMSAQPTTLDPTLSAATKSDDTVAPIASISAPADNATISNGTSVTATGTAMDLLGQVAGVEVSTDNGATWHPATGTTSWTYTYIQHGTGATPLKVRAIDDSANIGPVASLSLTVKCPCSVFGAEVPKVPAANDSGSVELGLRFSPTTDGFVSGVRFYKGTGNTGTHKGALWTTSGQQLATVSFSNETATGWQTANFGTPVPVSKDTTYVVSYTAPNGRYASLANAFTSRGLDAAPFAVAGGFGATPAGVYANPGQFPSNSYQNTNYYVDALFTTTDESPLIATNHWPLPDSSSVPANTTVRTTFSKPVTAGTATLTLKDANGATVAGATAYNTTTRVITFTPNANLNGFVKYTATVGGVDAQGNSVTTGKTWSFTTAKPTPAPGVCPCSIFNDSTVPTVLEDSDSNAVTLGVRFASDTAGTVTAVKFYKGPNNTGSHTGTLWKADGTKLAEGTFSSESSSGWQTLVLSQPISIAKDTEYIAAYRTTVGKYSVTPGGFSSDVPGSPLRTAASSGSYTYGTGFPNQRSSANYMVDLVFERPTPQIAIDSQDPAPGAVDVGLSSSIGVWFNDTIKSTGYSMVVKQGSTTIAGTTTLNAEANKLTFKPGAKLPLNADITVTLTGVESTSGAQLGTKTWTFRTTASDDPTEPQTLFGDQIPATQAANEGSAVELGTAFSPSKDGKIKSIRFFKGTGNGGTHIGRIWSSSGQQLATVQFSGETPNGWQSANLSQPLTVTAGTTYVVSYLAPQGRYSYTTGFFNNPYTSGDLKAPASNNGRYLYGAGGGYPTYSWGASNYFVDVSFLPDAATVTMTAKSPAANATDVPRSSKVTATFSAPIATGYAVTVKQGATAIAGTTTLSTDKTKLTFTPTSTLPADADITVTVSGIVSEDGATLADQTWTFRTETASTAEYSLFADQTPATLAINDSDAVEVGTAFSPSVAGSITGMSFYKGTGNGGTHVGNLWSSTGTKLGTVTFSGESSTGWQTANFATPIPVTAGQTYVISYLAPQGRYSGTAGFFNNAYTAGPLSARAGNNGLYKYGATGGFPTGSFNSTNYFVDVIFRAAS